MSEMRINEESAEVLPKYSRIPVSFEVCSVFDVQPTDRGLGGFTLSEHAVKHPWVKDYDEVGERPEDWEKHRDTSNWGVLSAYADDSRVGGCVIADGTSEVHKLGNRKDIAVLWDIRVLPHFRGKGIGSRLLGAAVEWAARQQCRLLTAETQNTNVPACRFYAKNGFTLGSVTRAAYVEFPEEVELVWYRAL